MISCEIIFLFGLPSNGLGLGCNTAHIPCALLFADHSPSICITLLETVVEDKVKAVGLSPEDLTCSVVPDSSANVAVFDHPKYS